MMQKHMNQNLMNQNTFTSNQIKSKLRILETSKFFESPRTVTEIVQQLREYGWATSPLDVSKILAKMASVNEMMKILRKTESTILPKSR